MIWLRVFMFVLAIYYIMLIVQVITGLKWTSSKVTFLKFIVPFYFWFTINKGEKQKDEDDQIYDDYKSSEIYTIKNGKWVKENNKKK